LDGLRGVLALTVFADHVLKGLGCLAFQPAARVAVMAFFVMSGLVLARSYDGRPLSFVLRRMVRLWPLYTICILTGHALFHIPLELGELVWAQSVLHGLPACDPPAWTLYMEAWATFFLPPMFWLAARSRAWAVVLPIASILLIAIDDRLYFVSLFAVGVALARFQLPVPSHVPAPALWLGKISFSLYLSHGIVLQEICQFLGLWGLVPAIPVCFIVAWGLWRTVEIPSIALSHWVGGLRIHRPTPRLLVRAVGDD
jgi:peptidoglycan/LPS O-acetylase OafA/YrhL